MRIILIIVATGPPTFPDLSLSTPSDPCLERPHSMYICLCNAITDRQIVRAAEEGARSSEDLAMQLGVGMGCGRCRSCAKALLVETIGRIACGPNGFVQAPQGETP